MKQLHDSHNVLVLFPNESDERSSILLVYDPLSAHPSAADKMKHLEEVSKEILRMVKDCGDVKSEILTVDRKWHEAVLGRGGTTLNA